MVNIEELSAKELYELAKKKEQEEARLAQAREQLKKLEDERGELLRKHQQDLAETDRQIEELKARKERLVDGHQKALAILEKRITSLSEEVDAKKVAASEAKQAATVQKKAETPPADKPAEPPKPPLPKEDLPPPSDEAEEPPAQEPERKKEKGRSEAEEMEILLEHLQKIMKGRSYISDSLLREKLQAAKFKPANLSKLLDTLVKQAKLVRRSGGNYVLGRMAKKK